MYKIAVIGGGLVGASIARDLSETHDVTVFDKDITWRIMAMKHRQMDCSREFTDALAEFDLVVNALPGFLGYNALQQIIKAGKNCVDISFFKDDPFTLDQMAKAADVSVVVDCGVAPGLCNMMLGYASTQLRSVQSYECVVGGLPYMRLMPWQYKAPYSPADVIEFYMRPARIVRHGSPMTVAALSEIENEDTQVGTLESFNTDGLRTLLTTMSGVPNMRERTYRWPGTANLINILKDTGFFSKIPFTFKTGDPDVRVSVSPLELTSEVLKLNWMLEPGEDEFTLMKVTVDGITDEGKNTQLRWTLFDEFDGTDSSMARSTGFTCNAAVKLMLDGRIDRKGIIAPEELAMMPGRFDSILDYLDERSVNVSYESPSSSF